MFKRIMKTVFGLLMAFAVLPSYADVYPAAGSSTEPNVWTKNYSGVLAASKGTGYPILLLLVKDGCSHCHTMMTQSINTPEFAAMDKELKFYKLIVDGEKEYKILMKYKGYFNYNMYPLAAVLRMDGSVYGSFGNKATDSRNVAPELRTLIENLSAEQTGDGSVVTPVKPAMSAADWGAKLKGKVNGILFDGNQEIGGSFVLSITAKGKANAKFTTMSGRATVKGGLEVKNDAPQFVAESLSLTYDPATQVWSGRWGGYAAYASTLPSSAFSGLYTSPAANAASSGYATVSLKSGKGKVAGRVGGKNKISVSSAVVVLPAAVVANGLARWDSGTDVVFVPIVKAGKFSGGAAIGADGRMATSFSAFGGMWSGMGGIWSETADLGSLGGKVLRITTGAGVFEVPIRSVDGKKLVLGDNDMSAKASVAVKKGTFKGGVKISGAKYTFEGAMMKDGANIFGMGVSYGAGVYPVEISEVK